ncbi:hypothetical protein Tco_0085191 [Tanacetum coccineum]
MRTRSQARRRRQPQVRQTSVESPNLEKPNPPIVTMEDNRTMAQLLEAPTEGYEDAIVVPEINANNFEIKHGLLNLVQNKQFFGHDKEDPHAHIRYFNKITSTMKFPTRPGVRRCSSLCFIHFTLEGAAAIWLDKEPPTIDLYADDLVSIVIIKILSPAFPHHGFSELPQLDTFYNALNTNDQDSLNSAAGGNFLDKMPRECLKIIESKSKVRNSRSKPVVAKVSASTSTSGISPDVSELKDMVVTLEEAVGKGRDDGETCSCLVSTYSLIMEATRFGTVETGNWIGADACYFCTVAARGRVGDCSGGGIGELSWHSDGMVVGSGKQGLSLVGEVVGATTPVDDGYWWTPPRRKTLAWCTVGRRVGMHTIAGVLQDWWSGG